MRFNIPYCLKKECILAYLEPKKILLQVSVSLSSKEGILLIKLSVVLQSSFGETSHDCANDVTSSSTIPLGLIMSVATSLSIVPSKPATLFLYQPYLESKVFQLTRIVRVKHNKM